MNAPREWSDRLARIERMADTGHYLPRDVLIAELAAIRAQVTGIEAAFDALTKRLQKGPL